MDGVFERFGLQVGEKKQLGEATLSTYEYKSSENPLYNLRSMRDDNGLMMMNDGNYVRLHVGNQLVMSDTRMEKNTNSEFIKKANGRVFIAGLGIGLILHNLLPKLKSKLIKEIVVMEISQDVIDLVSPYYKEFNIRYICYDILKYQPKRFDIFDTIYFDIWATISEDNLTEMTKLHNKWKFRKNKKNAKCWMGSWMQKWLQAEKRKEARYSSSYGW